MLNDRDNDKYEGHEESEYHFSEDEINYELEGESPKTETAAVPETKAGFLNRLTRSRRMLISLGVFLVLVFIVYKMVAPTSTVPPTTIAAAPMQTSPAAPMPAAVTTVPPAATPVVPVAAVTPAPAAPVPAQAPVVQAAPAAPANSIQTSPAMQMAQQLAAAQAQGTAAPAPAQPVQNPAAAVMPAVIPVQAPVPTTTTVTTTADTNVSSLTAESERLIGQLQLQYTQQLNSFANQNKMLQDQIQALSARMSTMENQLNQLVQVLTRRTQNSSAASPPPAPPPAVPVVQQSIPIKIAYNVQAIIPGRAWLKSDSGETLTVAEGDVIKDIGRVTKIDPYDGIVEINTGTKSVSLSYGNGS